MSDLFAPLREPDSVSRLAPGEVRRRGDRLRRRRAGAAVAGAVCAAAIVVGGTSLLVGDWTSSDSAPGPVDSPPADVAIRTELDLSEGLPREIPSSAGAPELMICGESFPLGDRATASVQVRYSDYSDQGDLTARGLSVYPDAGTARAVATDLVAAFESCPRSTDGRGRAWTTSVRPTDHGDQGWVVARFADAPGPRVDAPEAIQIVRIGASLLVIRQREVHGIPVEALERDTSAQVEWLVHRQMCLLTDEGCAWRSDPDILRPDGWGPLRLGMSREDVEATTSAGFSSAGGCTTVDLGSGEGLLSESDELVSLRVTEGVTTPEGIGPGSSHDEVLEMYPSARQVGDVRLVRASPTTEYEITFEGDQVGQLTLSAVGDECPGALAP